MIKISFEYLTEQLNHNLTHIYLNIGIDHMDVGNTFILHYYIQYHIYTIMWVFFYFILITDKTMDLSDILT